MKILALHKTETRQPKHAVRAAIERVSLDQLKLTFEIQGADNVVLKGLDFPDKPQRRDELWKSTCLECFISKPGLTEYREFNFAVNGDWAAYKLASYRAPLENLNLEKSSRTAPELRASSSTADASGAGGKICRVEILFPVDQTLTKGPLQISLAAVIIEPSYESQPFYWALVHTAEKPDFHRRESFVLELT